MCFAPQNFDFSSVGGRLFTIPVFVELATHWLSTFFNMTTRENASPDHPRFSLPKWAEQTPGQTPEPIEWRKKPSLGQRIWRAASFPTLTAIALFIGVVCVSIALVWAGPNTPQLNDSATTEAQLSQKQTMTSELFDTEEAENVTQTTMVTVHVVGEVHAPGVFELAPGSRVSAAVEAAGGPTDGAALGQVNLARVVKDGEQIVVPNLTQMSPGPAVSSDSSATSGPLNLNTAEATDLESLPRVGPALAAKIIQWRDENGGFTEVEQLLGVSGIGKKTFEGLRDLVTV